MTILVAELVLQAVFDIVWVWVNLGKVYFCLVLCPFFIFMRFRLFAMSFTVSWHRENFTWSRFPFSNRKRKKYQLFSSKISRPNNLSADSFEHFSWIRMNIRRPLESSRAVPHRAHVIGKAHIIIKGPFLFPYKAVFLEEFCSEIARRETGLCAS